MDINFTADAAQHAPAVKHVAKHVTNIAHAVPVIKQGFSMLTLFISNLITAVIFGGGAWYARGRGWFGVKVDLTNAKNAVSNEVSKIETAATPSAPAAG